MSALAGRRRWLVPAVIVGVLLVLAFLATRAFSGPSEPSANPALVTPSHAAVFATLDLDPPGDEGTNLKIVMGKLLGNPSDPGSAVAGAVDQLLAASGSDLRFEGQVRSWLGSHAGFFVTRFGAGSRLAVLLETSDKRAAQRALDRLGPNPTSETVGDVKVATRADGLSWALVDDFAVVGTKGGVVDAARASTGFALGEADRYTQAVNPRLPNIGMLYVDVKHLIDAVPASVLGGPESKRDFRLRLARVEDKPTIVTLSAPDDENLAVDFSSPPGDPDPESPTQVGGGADGTALLPTRLLPQLPANAWLAFDFPEFGQRLFDAFDPKVNPGLPSDSLVELEKRLGRNAKFSVRDDLIAWLGGIAAFVRGSGTGGVASLEAGVVAESLNPAASRRAVDKLRDAMDERFDVGPLELKGMEGFAVRIPGVARPVIVYARGNRVVAGLGPAAALDAIDAPRKLGTVPAYREAAGKLGGTLLPGAWVAVPAAADALGALGLSREAWWQAVAPVLQRTAYVLYGAKRNKKRALIGAGE